MGAVAQIAATHLAVRLEAQPASSLDSGALDEPTSIRVQAGLVRVSRTAGHLLHGWRDPAAVRDLLILLGERQPPSRLGVHARALLEHARAIGVERVVTFAAMGTPMHPAAAPRVFATATAVPLLAEATAAGAVRLDDGEITGMNGLLLGVAAEQGVPALGLLGEMPFFAAGMPNPKAAAAVLEVFARIVGIAIDLGPLHAEAARLEEVLLQQTPAGWMPAAEPAAGGGAGAAPAPMRPRVRPEVRERIEALFEVAGQDRAKALELKAELDRHGLFRDYEDRFLDLFRQGS